MCNSSTSFFFLTLRMCLAGKSFNLQLFFVQRPATTLNPDTHIFFYCMLFIIPCRPNPFPSVTGTSCGLIPARRSSEGWISVPSKPSVARMVMTTLLRWETLTESREVDFVALILLLHHHFTHITAFCLETFTMLTSACGSYVSLEY